MPFIAPGEVLNGGNPKLRFWLTYNDIKQQLSSLQFIVYDVRTPANQASPVQVYPTPSGRSTVNLATYPSGDYLSSDQGYAANFTFPSTAASGLYQIRWFYKFTSASTEGVYKFEFWVT